jgi:hypothetical protein
MCQHLGIDPTLTCSGRPRYLLEIRDKIAESGWTPFTHIVS